MPRRKHAGGRPANTPGQPLSEHVMVRFSQQGHALIEEAATLSRVTKGAFLREAGLAAARAITGNLTPSGAPGA